MISGVAADGAPSAAASSASGGYASMLVGSLTVLGLICLAAYLAVRLLGRRGPGGRTERVIEVVARTPLEPRRSLYVVEVGGKTLLVGASELGLSLLTELDRNTVFVDAERKPQDRGFVEAVRAVLGRGHAPSGLGPRTGVVDRRGPTAEEADAASIDRPRDTSSARRDRATTAWTGHRAGARAVAAAEAGVELAAGGPPGRAAEDRSVDAAEGWASSEAAEEPATSGEHASCVAAYTAAGAVRDVVHRERPSGQSGAAPTAGPSTSLGGRVGAARG